MLFVCLLCFLVAARPVGSSTEFWGVEILDDRAFTLCSELVNTLYDDYVSAIPLTRTNAKMYNQYESMVKFYGPKKMLDVRQRVETMVK